MKSGGSHKALKKYCEERISQVTMLMGSRKNLTQEQFHELRVEIKKLKAITLLVNFCCKGFKRKKVFKHFRALFKQAGKIREMQLEIKSLRDLELTKALEIHISELKRKITVEKEIFSEDKNRDRVNKLEKTADGILVYVKKLRDDDIRKYLDNLEKKITVFLKSGIIKKADLHELRILLKQYYYILKIGSPDEKRLGKIEKFLDDLGNWHDDDLLSVKLKEYLDGGLLPPVSLKTIRTVRERLMEQNRQVFLKIRNGKEIHRELFAGAGK